MKPHAIEKVLSPNDTGQTGGHQAGILVPKDPRILPFFPVLDSSVKNPRALIDVFDDAEQEWTFNFIYYNNKFFGGSRNEYRLTGMTGYFREFNLKAGDKIILRRESSHRMRIAFQKPRKGDGVLKLSLSWRVVQTAF